jgi:hypothetical protein
MSDTQRTRAELLALLADNASGAISEQDLRDVLVSVLGGYGHLFFFTKNVTANIATQTLSTWGTGPASGVTLSGAAGTLTVPVDGDYFVSFSATFSGTAGRKVSFSSGALPMTPKVKLDSAGDDVAVSWSGIVTLAAATAISILYAADVDWTAVSFTSGSLAVRRVG